MILSDESEAFSLTDTCIGGTNFGSTKDLPLGSVSILADTVLLLKTICSDDFSGWYAVDHLHPDWNVWGQFVADGMQMAFQLDSLRTSHPIEVPVKNALEVDQIFDHISYLKGSSVIRMLAAHLGVKTFLKGVSDYLKAHTYANAKTSDLWAALSKASGQDVDAFMGNWIRKIGFPVVTIVEEPGQLNVKQSRFLTSGEVKPEEDETTWWIPLGVKTGASTAEVRREPLTSKQNVVRNVDSGFYKINADQTGFYRTNLPPQRLAEMGRVLDRLSVEDKIGLIGDAAAMAISGHGTTPAVLSFIEGFKTETNYLVWSSVLASLGKIRSIFSYDSETAEGLRGFTLNLVSQAVEAIGWEFVEGESYLTGQLRSLLIGAAGLAGHETTVEGAQKRFQAFLNGDQKAIHPSLRAAVYKISVKYGGEEAYRAVQREYLQTTSIDGKEIALHSMGSIQTPELALDYLAFAFGGKVAVQDVHSVGSSLAANSKTRDALWQYIQQEWPMIRSILSGNMVVLERFLRVSLPKFASFEREQEITKFFGGDTAGYDRGLAVVSDTIKGNAQYRERDQVVVKEWLREHNFLQ
jgi:aminopeptidase N